MINRRIVFGVLCEFKSYKFYMFIYFVVRLWPSGLGFFKKRRHFGFEAAGWRRKSHGLRHGTDGDHRTYRREREWGEVVLGHGWRLGHSMVMVV